MKKFMSKRGFLARKINKIAVSLHKGYENLNYVFEKNGEFSVIKKIKNSTFKVESIFDVGANHGEWSTMVNNIFPEAKIHSFEVLPSTYKHLIEACKGIKNIQCHEFGLSDSDQILEATISSASDGLTTLVPDFTEEFHSAPVSHTTVQTKNGGSFCDTKNIEQIDLLKIDVEGYENKVLLGLEGMIKQGKVKIIQFEYGFINVKTHFLLYDFYEFFKQHNMRVGKIYPSYVDFGDYVYQDENFYGPNYLAVHESEVDLIASLSKKL